VNQKKKPQIPLGAFVLLVGRARFELVTNGLKEALAAQGLQINQ